MTEKYYQVLASIKSMSTADIEKKMSDLAIVFKVYRDNGWEHDTSYQGAANIYARCIDELNNRDNK